MNDHELDQLLQMQPVEPNARKAAALMASVRALPRQQLRIGHAGWALIFAVGLAAGYGASFAVRKAPETIVETRIVEVPVKEEPRSEPPAAVAKSLDALETEAELASAAEAAKLYRRIGDLYLEKSDVKSALRCYRLHLTEAGPEGLARAEGDSWLLTSLKTSTNTESDR